MTYTLIELWIPIGTRAAEIAFINATALIRIPNLVGSAILMIVCWYTLVLMVIPNPTGRTVMMVRYALVIVIVVMISPRT